MHFLLTFIIHLSTLSSYIHYIFESKTSSWIKLKGSLYFPSKELVESIHHYEEVFVRLHGEKHKTNFKQKSQFMFLNKFGEIKGTHCFIFFSIV